MRITRTALLALATVAAPFGIGPTFAATHDIAAGEGAQQRLQEALITAQPGDEVLLGAGRFMLDDGLSLDVEGVTVRGAGMDATVLDFSGQQGAGEGLLVTSDRVTLRDFAVENAHGDGIKSKGADEIVYYRVRVSWTGGPKETNGAYGIYPVESSGVLIDSCQVEGASDAGIYVGQSKDITVRHSLAQGNVAGDEIENSRNALVTNNMVTRNTGGILVFDLPNLPVMGGGNTVLMGNLVVGNDTPNFAPKGNIVAAVRRGTGVMVMANDGVRVTHNIIRDNPTTGVMVVSFPRAFTDTHYNPTPRNVMVDANTFAGNGTDPQMPGADALKSAFGGALPPVIWDGIGPAGTLMTDASGLSLNLARQGDAVETARPAPFKATAPVVPVDEKTVGAPPALEARLIS